MCKGESDPSKVVDDVVARVAFAKKILSVVSRQWSSAIMLPATSSRQNGRWHNDVIASLISANNLRITPFLPKFWNFGNLLI